MIHFLTLRKGPWQHECFVMPDGTIDVLTIRRIPFAPAPIVEKWNSSEFFEVKLPGAIDMQQRYYRPCSPAR